jgi:hypothetical protein
LKKGKILQIYKPLTITFPTGGAVPPFFSP